MSTRLQVVIDHGELMEIRTAARRRGMTVSQWVRSAVRDAMLSESTSDPARQLAVIAAASEHSFPSGDIDEMLAQIESGYAGPLA